MQKNAAETAQDRPEVAQRDILHAQVSFRNSFGGALSSSVVAAKSFASGRENALYMPSLAASRRNLAKTQARWRAPRPWRCETETQLIRHVALKWCNDLNRRWSGRGLARRLGVSQMYIWKLTRQFEGGKLNVRSPLSGGATFEELGSALGSARWQTRKMKEQGLLRETTRQMMERVLGWS